MVMLPKQGQRRLIIPSGLLRRQNNKNWKIKSNFLPLINQSLAFLAPSVSRVGGSENSLLFLLFFRKNSREQRKDDPCNVTNHYQTTCTSCYNLMSLVRLQLVNDNKIIFHCKHVWVQGLVEDVMDSIINGHINHSEQITSMHDVFSTIIHNFINVKSVASIKVWAISFSQCNAWIMIWCGLVFTRISGFGLTSSLSAAAVLAPAYASLPSLHHSPPLSRW